tara:strand:+ start:232 stop:1194 length:963 start_codon:yes stop_codon:yes gene_type:complete
MTDLYKYSHYFKKLRRDYKNGGAPHKPILLLAIINQFEKQLQVDNRIYITPEIISDFKFYWSKLVVTKHDAHFTLPFFHMKSEPFWRLIPNQGCEKWVLSKSPIRSFSSLKTAVDHAKIDNELFELLSKNIEREVLKQQILESYFKETKSNLIQQKEIVDNLSDEILNEDPSTYKNKIQELQKKLDNTSFEEEVFIRNGAFKRSVSRVYSDTCAISNLKIDATSTYSAIDACHIVPFSESKNNHITNGIALCPNLHRAFDRGLIAIDDNYRLLVNSNFKESKNTLYGILQFKGKEVNLPENKNYLPLIENLAWHRKSYNF